MRLALLFIVTAALAACSTHEVRIAHSVGLNLAPAPYAEAELMDVGVVVFNSGIPEGEVDSNVLEELMENGTFVQIRRAEAMFMANVLSDTLRNSGHWGSVWVTPRDSTALDLNVSAEILQSDGYVLELRVIAADATGRRWLSKKYDMETAQSAYNRQIFPDVDPYQDVFNRISNDLATMRGELTALEIADIRTIGELRYANALSPEAFGDYLEQDRDGVYEPVRLPASGDPMLQRTRSIRQREQLFFETMDQYYDEFSSSALDSYDGWREYSREDSIRANDAARAAKSRVALGVLSIALSIAYGRESDANSLADSILRTAGYNIGVDLIRSAATRRQERRLATQNLQELAEDFDDSVKVLVIDVQGTQRRLTGTADARYEEWQIYLKELYQSETGFDADDIKIYIEPESEEATPDASGGTAAEA